MLPVVVLQLFVAGASAAALTIQIQTPFDGVFGDRPWKHFPHPHPNPDKTIYDTINGDGRFSYLAKAINFVGQPIIDVLSNHDEHITFFAVPDKALHHGHGHHGHHDEEDEDNSSTRGGDYGQFVTAALAGSQLDKRDIDSTFGGPTPDFMSVLRAIDSVDTSLIGDDDGDDDDEHKRRKDAIKFVVNAILQYHVLPYPTEINCLRENNTYPTHLALPVALGGRLQRLRVENRYKKHKISTYLNHFSKVVVPDVKAGNGYINVVNHPIMPPAPVFQELFLMQKQFATFTSAIQRAGLTDELDLRYVWDKESEEGHFEGSAAVTVFAVKNEAFDRLPRRLKWFLFSPFGRDALRKLLEYHIVPGAVVHSDYFYNQTAETNPGTKRCPCMDGYFKKHKDHGHREPISSIEATLDTRFRNHTVDLVVEKSKLTFPGHKKHQRPTQYEAEIHVNGHKVKITDIVGLNGAIHVIDRIMCPWHHDDDDDHHHHHGDEGDDDVWAGWETRLPQLVAEAR